MVTRVIDWTKTRRGMWAMLICVVILYVPLVMMLADRHMAWRADREMSAATQFQVAAWLAEPIFAEDNRMMVELGDSVHTTRISEKPESEGPRVLLTQPTPGEWYTQLWQDNRMLCRSPRQSANKATYGPESPRELELSWADYADDVLGACFAYLQPCETFELRALRELSRRIDGQRYTRYAAPLKHQFTVPCDWRPAGAPGAFSR